MNPKVESFLKKTKSDKNLRLSLIKAISMSIDHPMNVNQGGLIALQAFRLNIIYKNEPFTSVSRRFNDFLWLEKALSYDFLGRIIPVNPPKNFLTKLQLTGQEFMSQRINGINRFCRMLLDMAEINLSDHTFHFFFSSRREFTLHQEEFTKQMIDIESQGILSRASKIASKAFSFLM